MDTNDLEAVRAAINGGNTTMVMLESPTNPRLQITDLRAISDMVGRRIVNVAFIIDLTFAGQTTSYEVASRSPRH